MFEPWGSWQVTHSISALGAPEYSGQPRLESPPWAEWAASIAAPALDPPAPEAIALNEDELWEEPAGPDWFGSVVAGLASMLFHLVVMISLGLWITAPCPQVEYLLPLTVLQETEEEAELELETILLDEQLAQGALGLGVCSRILKRTNLLQARLRRALAGGQQQRAAEQGRCAPAPADDTGREG